MAIVIPPQMQFEDLNGLPYAFGKAYIYLTGTNTLATIYEDANFVTTAANPMIADDAGLFPARYFTDDQEYRVKVTNASGSVTVLDADPFNQTLLITADQIADGAIEAKLGYTPVDPANAAFTAPATMIYAIEPVSLSPFTIGYLGSPASIEDQDYQFILSDAGKMIVHDDANPFNYTIPLNADVPFPVGTSIWLANINSGLITLVRGTDGVTTVALRAAGTPTDEDKTLNQWALALLKKTDTDAWIIFGALGGATITKNAAFTLGPGDNGATFIHDDASAYAWTLDPEATTPLPVGFEFEAINSGSGVVTITRGAAVELRVAGSATDGNIAMAQWDRAKIKKIGADSWMANYA